DIILGEQIVAPSMQRQLIADIEGGRDDQATSITTKTTNVHGDAMVVTTTSNYEQDSIVSVTDWRQRALACCGGLRAKAKEIFAPSLHNPDSPTLVLPEAVLERFVAISDIYTQCAGLLYGVKAEGIANTYEVKAVVIPPQFGSHKSVTFPTAHPPSHPALASLLPLGWIHTAPQILPGLASSSAIQHSHLVKAFPEWTQASLCVAAGIGPGSVGLSCHALNQAGLTWGESQNPDAHDESLFDQAWALTAGVHVSPSLE
ncbi:pre-mRNA-processing-splicing factor 8, partial [Kipferlia bialata]